MEITDKISIKIRLFNRVFGIILMLYETNLTFMLIGTSFVLVICSRYLVRNRLNES